MARTAKRHRSLLDAGTLPVDQLAFLAKREGWRPVPIYQIHRWFARRFSSAFRAILVAAKLTDHERFWDAFYEGVDYHGTTVLDPFVGGGTSVVEAAQLGATTIGVDIDPVACAITQFELSASSVPDLLPTLAILNSEVGSKLDRYYRTSGPDGEPRQIVHGFWVQVVRCCHCGRGTEAHPTFQLAYDTESGHQWAFCSSCHAIRRLPINSKSFTCKKCRAKTEILAAPVTHGRFTCPTCQTEENLIDVAARTDTPPSWRLFALETIPCGESHRRVPMSGRDFQSATSLDRRRVREARNALSRLTASPLVRNWIPDRRIPVKRRADNRLIKYGYRRYRELFNPRQLLHLALLAEAIDGLSGQTREALALAFSDHLTTNCMLTHYAFGWRRLSPLFSIRAYRHICRPVEVNPWLDGTGRGTFPNTVRQVDRAVRFSKAPYVAHLNGGFVRSTNHAAAVETRSTILVENSRELVGVADASVDLILTDPPYCDNIAYSELSDFYLPWLQQFGLATANKKSATFPSNLAARSRGIVDVAGFRQGLADCFVQMRRVLKPDGRVVFSYQHRTADAWDALAAALFAGGFVPVQVFPLLGNSPAGLHQHEGTVLWDAVLVCRKGPDFGQERGLHLSETQIAAAARHASTWATRLEKCKHATFRLVDHENLLRATLVATSLGMLGNPANRGQVLLDVLNSPPLS